MSQKWIDALGNVIVQLKKRSDLLESYFGVRRGVRDPIDSIILHAMYSFEGTLQDAVQTGNTELDVLALCVLYTHQMSLNPVAHYVGELQNSISNHHSRWFRGLGGYFLYRTGTVTLPGPVDQMYITRKSYMRAVSWNDFDFNIIYPALQRLCGVIETPERLLTESSFCKGQTYMWERDHAFPIMSTLFCGGSSSFEELKYLDPQTSVLTKDISILENLGLIRVTRHGGIFKSTNYYDLTNSSYWAGSPMVV